MTGIGRTGGAGGTANYSFRRWSLIGNWLPFMLSSHHFISNCWVISPTFSVFTVVNLCCLLTIISILNQWSRFVLSLNNTSRRSCWHSGFTRLFSRSLSSGQCTWSLRNIFGCFSRPCRTRWWVHINLKSILICQNILLVRSFEIH